MDDNGNMRTLENVLHVPHMKNGLLSLTQLGLKGWLSMITNLAVLSLINQILLRPLTGEWNLLDDQRETINTPPSGNWTKAELWKSLLNCLLSRLLVLEIRCRSN